MKKSVYTAVLGGVALLALSACMQEDAPGDLNRDRTLMLRGDGMAIQRYEYCPGPMEGEHRWKHHHRHHHMMKHKAAAKVEAKKEDVKKDEKAKKDSK